MNLRLACLLFVLLVVLAIAVPKLALSQSETTALCSDGFCVVLEAQLRDIKQHLINLRKLLDERKCI